MCTRVNKRADVPERMYVPGTRAVMIEFCLQFHAFVRRSKAIGCLVANWQWMSKGLARNAKQQNDRAKAEDETSQKINSHINSHIRSVHRKARNLHQFANH